MARKIKVVDTNSKKKHGVNRCPKCGSGEITYSIEKQKLVCNYCHTEFSGEKIKELEKEPDKLKGENRTTGSKDIKETTDDLVTLKCDSCGAEVIINTAEATHARCHWCRSILSINSQMDNGAIPDLILPFKLTKEEAQQKINQFVSKRKFFANSNFKKEFTIDNIMGVYFPYMLVDANCYGKFEGVGGHVAKTHNLGFDEDSNKAYDIDIYSIEREFNISINDLSIESNIDKLEKDNPSKTTNIINSIMPFDTDNCVKYKGNYMAGFTSEKRDINISSIEDKVNQELKDIARHSLIEHLNFYGSGVNWENEYFEIRGRQWVTAYLPVWLYSYQDSKKTLHYVAVNARTGEVMGSVPTNSLKILSVSLLIFIIIFLAMLGSLAIYSIPVALAVSAFFFAYIDSRYRNDEARHEYEVETRNKIEILSKNDKKIKTVIMSPYSELLDTNYRHVVGEQMEVQNNDTEKKEEE